MPCGKPRPAAVHRGDRNGTPDQILKNPGIILKKIKSQGLQVQ